MTQNAWKLAATIGAVFMLAIPVAAQQTVIVETEEGGQNSQLYSETAGTWEHSIAKSEAPGLSGVDLGSRFKQIKSIGEHAEAQVAPVLPQAGEYEIDVTWGRSGNARNVKYVVETTSETKTVYLDQDGWGTRGAPNCDQWHSLGVYNLPAEGAVVKVLTDESDGPLESRNAHRVYADAFRFAPPGAVEVASQASSSPSMARPSQPAPSTSSVPGPSSAPFSGPGSLPMPSSSTARPASPSAVANSPFTSSVSSAPASSPFTGQPSASTPSAGSPFTGQPSTAAEPPRSPFSGQPSGSAPSTSPFTGQSSAPSSAPSSSPFVQPAAPASSPFAGQPTAPARSSPFAQPSAPASSPFAAQPSTAAAPSSSSPFAQPSAAPSSPFAGQPSAPAGSPFAGQPSTTSSSPFATQPSVQPSTGYGTRAPAVPSSSPFGSQPSTASALPFDTQPSAPASSQVPPGTTMTGQPTESPFGVTQPAPGASTASPFDTSAPAAAAPSAPAAPQAPAWVTYKEGIALGKETHRPILLYFAADTASVRKFEAEVYEDPAVKNAMAKYVLVRIPYPQSKELIKYYGVGLSPTLIFLGSDGYTRSRVDGVQSVDTVLAELNSLLK